MSYMTEVLKSRPSQYYTLSGASGASDISGMGSTAVSGYTSKISPGLVPGYTASSVSGATGPNTFKLLSTGATSAAGTTLKSDTFTVEFWCNPAAGNVWDEAKPLSIPLFKVGLSGSGVYYHKDRFRFWLINGSTQYYADYFAPEPDQRYHVSAVYLKTAFYLVINGAAGEPTLLSSPFTFGYNEPSFTIGTPALQHLAIYPVAQSLESIRSRTNAGMYSHNFQEFVVRDKGQLHVFDTSSDILAVDDVLDTQDFAHADLVNVVHNNRSNLTLMPAASISSMSVSGATGTSFSSSGYSFIGSTAALTNNYIYTTGLSRSCSAVSGMIAAQVTHPASGSHTLWTIDTPSQGKNWVLGIGATGVPRLTENSINADGSTGAVVYQWTSPIDYTRTSNIVMVMTEYGVALHSATNNANSVVNQSGSLNFAPITIAIDSTSELIVGQDTTFAATPPTAVRALALYNKIPSDYGTTFDSAISKSPSVLFQLTKNMLATQYGEMTLTSPIQYQGAVAGSIVDYGMVDGLNNILGVTGLVAYYDARYVNGLTGVSNLLTVNQATVETDLTGWAAVSNCTLSQSSLEFLEGYKSMQVNVTASSVAVFARTSTGTSGCPVTPSSTVTGVYSVKPQSSGTWQVIIYWWQAGGAASVTPSTNGGAITATAGQWNDLAFTTTAPADAAFASLAVYLNSGNAVAGENHYTDKFGLWSGSTTIWEKPGVNNPFTVAPATGAALSQWNDLSGNARHVTGATTFRPTYSPTGTNGLPAVSFVAASSQQLSYTSNNFLPAQTGFTVYSVASPVGVTAAGNGQALGPYLSSTSDARLALSLSVLGTTGQMWLRTSTTAATDTTPRGLVPDSTPSVYSATVNYSTKDISMSCNGLRYDAVASWTAGVTDAISNIAVGGTFGRYLSGNLSAVAIFTGVHDDETRAAIEGYLSLVWALPAPKGNGVSMKYNSDFYTPVEKRSQIPNFGPTGTVGTDISNGPLVTRATFTTFDAATWQPELSDIKIKIPKTVNISSPNYSDQAAILSYGVSLADKYRDPQYCSRINGAYFQAGGQIRIPADTINSYELIVIPSSSPGTGEILCVNPGTHYALTLTGLVLTSTGFTSVYVNGVLLSGSATLVANSPNHIIAISTTQLASPAYLNGHSTGTSKNLKYSTAVYAQYDYSLSASQIADHFNAADGILEVGQADTETYTTAENATPSVYSYTWEASIVSKT